LKEEVKNDPGVKSFRDDLGALPRIVRVLKEIYVMGKRK
jgi:hypothetical protein